MSHGQFKAKYWKVGRAAIIYNYNSTCNKQGKELELIQTQMTQKPMLRTEVNARAMRASQNRKEDSV
jgi:MFS superfamily sulfate permease-like transporter